MRRTIAVQALTFFVLATCAPADAADFGEFSPGPDGRFVQAEPRPVFELLKEFSFKDPGGKVWTVPIGARVDGASIPQPFWSFIGGPFEGPYLNASIIHDHYCETKEWSAQDTHLEFYYGMRSSGVPDWKAKLMYWAVASFGPDWTLEERIVVKNVCQIDAAAVKCVASPATERSVSVNAPVDLGDPDSLALALAKFSAVARTLKTTDGQTLDITSLGNVDASLASIERNADSLRQALNTHSYEREPEQLGVLSEWTAATLKEVEAWPAGKLPSFSTAPSLGEVDQLAGANSAYRLTEGEIGSLRGTLHLSPSTFEMPKVFNGK